LEKQRQEEGNREMNLEEDVAFDPVAQQRTK